ncbi:MULTISPECIES: PhnA-like protein [unclassified Rhizobium]|uniref:PhnA-like protein n=1 Tax=unclassified Rhizobium TaxID=2613769 RepID=UPI001ADC418C|nr:MULTISPECIES: PhnA-like protein [unclassified Rhizobium]MBO9100247.1 PhnA-like protein [Rhizobium sp. L58/93]MBO9135596.1 PhnA-like protein [Rhizobium sp. B209b/85]MBO9170213.1 PhnA-like protein [Rhizobium sp. L245/93]MBO9186140.1 PhnA-like protein [Rhizobium sp. E27B/91]QXZ83065.1 PhnA-like protein [Rhizobium sp. K1/93]
MTDPVGINRRAELAYAADPSDSALFNKISWGAIFAGVAVALAVQFLLNLLGVGIGAAVVDPAKYDNPSASSFSIGGGIWFVVAGLIAAFVGAYVAGRLSGRPSKSTGSFHGLTTWAVTTLVILYLLTTSIGAVVGGAFSGLGSMLGGVGQTASTAVSAAAPMAANANNPMADIEKQIRNASGGNDPEALRAAAVSAVQAVITGDQAKADDARNRAADAIAKAQNIPVDQAKAQVAQYEATYRTNMEAAKQKAIDAAQTATKVVSSGAILAFIALLLGAVASWFGGSVGTRAIPVATVAVNRGV